MKTTFASSGTEVEKGNGEQKIFAPLQHDGDFKPAQHSK
jgi:hypothetical protein